MALRKGGYLHRYHLLRLVIGVSLCLCGALAQGMMRKNPMRRFGAAAQHGLRPGRLAHARLGMSAAGGWQGPVIKDQFTVQIMTFKRPTHLMQAIRSLIDAPSLNKIVVIWNDDVQGRSYVDSGMPQFLREHKLRRPVEVVVTRTNDVTNRWRRQGHIATQAVFNMDDDTTVDLGTLEFGFSIWKKHPDQVIGFFDRVIYWDVTAGQYVYGFDAGVVAPEKYGIVIGKAWIASIELLQLAENDQDPLLIRMREFLHYPQREQKGCDDIAWNMFLHLRGAKPPIGLAGVRMDDIITWDGQKTTGYSAVSEADPDAWTRYRTHCIAGLLRVCGLQKPHLPPSPVQQYLVPAAAQPETFGTWELDSQL